MTDLTEEPGFGRYTDKDNQPGEFWIHDVDGWNYISEQGEDPNSLSRVAWANVKRWGPFTPLEEATEEPKVAQLDRVRGLALQCAATMAAGRLVDEEDVLTAARAFEAYLRGE